MELTLPERSISTELFRILSVDTLYATSPAGELAWKNASGQYCQITNGGQLDFSALGSITGMTGTQAAVTYSNSLKTFTFTSSANTPASIVGGALTIGQTGLANPNTITLQSPNSLAGSYNMTLPTSLPAFSSSGVQLLTTSSAGAIGDSNSPLVIGNLTLTNSVTAESVTAYPGGISAYAGPLNIGGTTTLNGTVTASGIIVGDKGICVPSSLTVTQVGTLTDEYL